MARAYRSTAIPFIAAFVAALALAFGAILGATPAAAVPAGTPSEDEIAASKAQEQATARSVADIEVDLANLSAQAAQLNQAKQEAQAAFERAQAAALEAKDQAEEALAKAKQAEKDVEKARAEMATIAQAMYQNSAGKLTGAYYFLGADSLTAAANHDRAMGLVADNADQQMRSFVAMQDVADALRKRADLKKAEADKLMQEADIAADAAGAAAAQADAMVAEFDEQRSALLSQLAAQKRTTKDLESKRFAALEAERIAREKAEAEAAAKKEAEQPGQPAPAPSRSVDTSKPVIDISSWQSPSSINYDALANSVSGVIIRIGYTGTSSGSSLNKDDAFERHYAEFTKRGVPVGVYWYSCANAGDEGAAEARAALKFLNGRSLDFPIYIDVEDPTHQSWASASVLTNQSVQFSKVISAGGYKPGIYASASWYRSKLNLSSLRSAGMSIWVAAWSSSAPAMGYDLWQYSSSGRLNGYSGRLDVNRRG